MMDGSGVFPVAVDTQTKSHPLLSSVYILSFGLKVEK